MTVKQKEFLKELHKLLLKYDASIYWTCDDCSDTYGIYDEKMVIDMFGQKDIEFTNSNSIDKYDIEDLIDIGKGE